MASTTRGETLAAPSGARRIPVLLLLAVVVAVVGAILVGLQGKWFLAILVPVAVASLVMVVHVVRTMVREIQAGRAAARVQDQKE